MDEDATVLDVEEVAPPPTTEPEAETETDAEPSEVAANDDGEADGEIDEGELPETYDFDFGGNRMSIPKGEIPEELADRVGAFTKQTWADYTRKSQANAVQAKELEARQAAVEKLHGLQGAALEEYGKGLSLRAEIAELDQIDLNGLWQSDPDQARAISDLKAQKQQAFQQTVASVQQHELAFSAERDTEMSRRMDEGRKAVEGRIKGFDGDAVIDYVTSTYGLDRASAEEWPLNPAVAQMAHKAMMYDRIQAKARAKPESKQAAPVKPVRGRVGGTKDPDKMSPEEWVRWRTQQIKAKQGR